mgnify:CR=1 FL=1
MVDALVDGADGTKYDFILIERELGVVVITQIYNSKKRSWEANKLYTKLFMAQLVLGRLFS